jgi:CheY-like chemotaxis protein
LVLASSNCELVNLKVMVVEDEAVTRTAMTVLLEYQGAIVVGVGSVAEGIQTLDQGFRPDILVSNIRLPDGTGAEVLRHLRQRDFITPAIALTGEALDTVRKDPTLAGFQLYLSKPYNSRLLVAEILKLVDP